MKLLKTVLPIVTLVIFIILFRTWYFSKSDTNTLEIKKAPEIAINEQHVLAHYAKALTFKTISSEVAADNYSRQFDQLHAFLKSTYPQVFSQLKVTNVGQHGLIMKWQGSDQTLQPVLFMAHQDVVPIAPGTEKSWHHSPFKGEIAEGYVWGRGALDCKASLIALFETTSLLLKNHFVPQRTIYFYFGDNEENGGDTAKLASDLLKKQGVHFAYVVDEASFIANGLFKHVTGQVALIGVVEKGYLNLELTANAEGGHSSIPPKITAIGALSNAIVNLLSYPYPPHMDHVTAQMFETMSQHMGFADRLMLNNMWLFKPYVVYRLAQNQFTNALIRTTEAPTIINAGIKSNVLPASASAVVNFRINNGDNIASVTNHVRNAINDPTISVTEMPGKNWEPSPVSSTTAIGYQLLSNTIWQTYGKEVLVAPFVLVGATDSRHFIPLADNVYRFFPIPCKKKDLARFHGVDERFASQDYIKMIRFYYTLVSAS